MTYPEINKTLISTYKIPLPLLDEQQRVVDKIDMIESEIIILKQRLKELQTSKSELLEKYL